MLSTMTVDSIVATPMMAQWKQCKDEAKEALLFFRLGDFYEAFYDDAEKIAKAIHLTLTARQGVPMCGVPFHTAELYIDKLLAKGFKIAVAEQTEEPAKGKGLVRREIVRRVSPGTLIQSSLLKEKQNNYFASIADFEGRFGLALLDLSTGEFSAQEVEDTSSLLDALSRAKPTECLFSSTIEERHPTFCKELSFAFPFLLNQKKLLDLPTARATLSAHFQKHIPLSNLAAIAAGFLLLYLKEELFLSLENVTDLSVPSLEKSMTIDRATMRHLDLFESAGDPQGKHSLFHFLDKTQTPMGGRLLGKWLRAPLFDLREIQKRQDAIEELCQRKIPLDALSAVRDLERLMTKIQTRYANARDLLALGKSLEELPTIKKLASSLESPFFKEQTNLLFDAGPLGNFLVGALHESPPLRIGEGETFSDSYHPDLAHLRSMAKNGATWMAEYQTKLREETGIKTLKVGYTRAFGYYIEVSRAQSKDVPATFQRRQTLTQAERFLTPELQTFEHQILSAEERIKALEIAYFEELRQKIEAHREEILKAAKSIAHFDAIASLASVAREHRFIRPALDDTDRIEIAGGRHPLLNALLGSASFIPNDTSLSQEEQMLLITGPNMAGKSTYIRQVALLVILAQMGSFIPARAARIGLVDKVFSRIGASDDLSRGQSTFMVEMSETAHILQNATSRSLILLDEIGRGTSTYDGIAIAWAVAEYLLTEPRRQAKTLFATHYSELMQLSSLFPHVKNVQTAIEETPSGIVFLRKIIPGGTDKSYGIHVARLAGLPNKVLKRAEKRLSELEQSKKRTSGTSLSEKGQLTFAL